MSQSSAVGVWAEYAQPTVHRKVARENQGLRRLYWLYFWLLIFEGVLRKWVAPSLAQPLLLIRDPIPLLVMWIGFRNRVLPRTVGVYLWAMLTIACAAVSFYQVPSSPATTLYGVHCDFLHLPMLLIAPTILEREDFVKLCRAILFVSIPTALLMVYQFYASPNSWINSGIDGTFKQIGATATHIRPPGPFSYIAGPFCLYGLCAALLFGFTIDKAGISRKLLTLASMAMVIAAGVSSSRTLVSGIAVVIAVGLAASLAINPRVFGRVMSILIGFGAFTGLLLTSSFLKEGTETFAERVNQASTNEGGTNGLFQRVVGDYASAIPAATSAPIAGYGLGTGTVGGSNLLTGRAQFLLAESEWPRVVMESGPILGGLFLLFRVYLMLWLGWRAIQAVRKGKTLPICLFAACAIWLIAGQFGQGTIVGFAMLTGGLCLTASKLANEPEAEIEVVEAEVVTPGLVRR